MKVTKAQAQANRAHIVETASTLFRERGYDGVGVADLMAAAGFTHGGFYKHFGSKADLMAEAAACGLTSSAAAVADLDVQAFVSEYLSRAHRDGPGQGCTLAALCTDAARQTDAVKAAFAAGIEARLATRATQEGQAQRDPDDAARARRIALMAQAVGALVLSRSCPDESPLADEILDACRADLLARLPAASSR
ncbi:MULTISPECIES: TetR/AcrR family transcriptional regulator [Stenotrophomonas]|jgi:TetR/AcrR family transcriptional repressor of nem operon|uniref:Transcriptional regulator, TetR family n=1 Tax=Stenotrophomonas indicatrix TaxID=2045451 RepID=A0A1W1GVJ9_9GAMM|nr:MULTISPECIES: TetR family transcriptional regulator [Stenotrophomonas]TPD99171.1 TetR family transcriptional regulator [Stenotrophomonas maltophilia]EZP47792.1 HTH-type transcriptional repressor dhaR [Stenotrophomonas sp. RIT309]MBO1749269.1 TetR family transcriptional regulator [Stenotrophomonas indicatrix]MCK6231439.1 TetR/AcrR family transcriptional regulator [Stenotrophomonas indicatrix]MDF2479969.1 TetR family transcriptional regulator [Stenotrophomonas indicatrix]